MSNDIWIDAYDKTTSVPIKRSLIEEILGPFAKRGNDGVICRVDFPDGSAAADIFPEPDESGDYDGFSFHRFGGTMFFEAVWQIADRSNGFIFWPGDEDAAAVTREEVLEHLPQDLIENFETIRVVPNGRELEAFYASTA